MNRSRNLIARKLIAVLLALLALSLAACGGAQALPTATPTLPPTQAPTLTAAPTQTPAPTATSTPTAAATAFDSQRAYQDMEYQMGLGPRTPGSKAHQQVVEWMQKELTASGWTAEVQETSLLNQPIRNVIGKRGSGKPWVILGAHFDSRMKADQDPDPAKRDQPVPAANDGAAGIGVLLELASSLPKDQPGTIWLAMIDSEDQGELPGWDWTLGSKALADSLTSKPDAVIIIDMIGDANLNIMMERNSDQDLTKQIWDTAAGLGYDKYFLPVLGYSMLDDHTPFLQKGIRAVDIIDFDYPYWHTTSDTSDKVSARSLQVVGDTLLHWLEQYTP